MSAKRLGNAILDQVIKGSNELHRTHPEAAAALLSLGTATVAIGENRTSWADDVERVVSRRFPTGGGSHGGKKRNGNGKGN